LADYFLVLDGPNFENQVRPPLAHSWRRRSFAPCRELFRELLPAAYSYAERYHTGTDLPLLLQDAADLPFDRTLWRTLVGEVLLFSARDIPEFQANADTLCCLLAPDHFQAGTQPREQLPPIRQVFRGTRDLTFGGAIYRPEQAGYNNAAEVARLAAYLEAVRPESWRPGDLALLPDLHDEADWEDELAFTREWFPVLTGLYSQAQEQGQVLVVESIF
jgi:hypothetical protein